MKTFPYLGAAICAFFSLLIPLLHAQPGSLDMTFNPGSGPNGQVYCIGFETNGQIVVGGNFTTFNGANRDYVARLNTDGSLDSAFYPGVGPNGRVEALAIRPDGEIFVAGDFNTLNGLSWNQPALFRIDGSVDTGFNTSNANGGGAPQGSVLAMVLQADGKVLLGGNFQGVNLGNGAATNLNGIARLETNGFADGTFNPGTGVNGSVTALGLQSTGQIIIGGNFSSINGQPVNGLGRLNSNGSVDSSFNAIIQDGGVQSLVVTPQDQIVIGGSFTSINGYSRNYIARLNANGSLDTTFNPGLGANRFITEVAVQPDADVIISGNNMTAFNGVSVAGGLARLNTNGTLDVAFNPGTGPNLSGVIVVSQPDGKTIIGGSFTSFNGTNINGIARLNNDTSSTKLTLLNPQLYFGMNLSGIVSNTYKIEWTANTDMPSLWAPLFNITLQTNPQFIFDPNPAVGQRFYQAVQITP